eukprot:gene76-12896_t
MYGDPDVRGGTDAPPQHLQEMYGDPDVRGGTDDLPQNLQDTHGVHDTIVAADSLGTCSMRQRKKSTMSSSAFRNVSWSKKSERYQAVLKYAGKELYIGCFISAIDAGQAIDKAVLCLNGSGVLNFPLSTYTNEQVKLRYDP